MKYTTPVELQQAIDEIFSLPQDLFLLDRPDFDKFFPTLERVKGFRISGESVSDISKSLQEEIPAGFHPAKRFDFYVSRDIIMQELADLDDVLGQPEKWKRQVIIADLPYGRITVYVFYEV